MSFHTDLRMHEQLRALELENRELREKICESLNLNEQITAELTRLERELHALRYNRVTSRNIAPLPTLDNALNRQIISGIEREEERMKKELAKRLWATD